MRSGSCFCWESSHHQDRTERQEEARTEVTVPDVPQAWGKQPETRRAHVSSWRWPHPRKGNNSWVIGDEHNSKFGSGSLENKTACSFSMILFQWWRAPYSVVSSLCGIEEVGLTDLPCRIPRVSSGQKRAGTGGARLRSSSSGQQSRATANKYNLPCISRATGKDSKCFTKKNGRWLGR